MKPSGRTRLLRLLVTASLSALAFVGAGDAQAQNPPRKNPGGPYVVPGNPLNSVEAGRPIQWTIQLTNPSPMPGVFTFVDDPQGGPTGECETGNPGNGQETPAAQSWLTFPDEGDGTCDAFVTVTGGSGFTITCDVATQHLQIDNINLGAFQSVTISFQTTVDIRANVGEQVCNWAHFTTSGGQRTDTYPYGTGNVAGCSCLLVAPPSGFDVDVTKTATIVPPATRLIPGDPSALIQYAITATNTGSQDITNAQLIDTVGGPTVAEGRGLEWVSVDDCPAGLTCALNATNTQLTVTGINLASADPDETITVLATARVTCAAATDIDNGRVCNQGQFSAPGQPGSFPTDDPATAAVGDATCLPVVWSNLTGTQKVVDGYDDTAPANGQLDAGERVHYRIRARNDGRITANGVTVTDDVNASGSLDPATIIALDGGVVAGGVITWSVGDIAPLGGTRDVRFSAVITGAGLCCNQGTVQSLERDGCGQAPIQTDDDSVSEDPATAPANATCIAPGPQPDLTVTKTVALAPGGDVDGDGQFDVGDRVRWTVTVVNNGAGTATAASFADTMSLCMRNFTGAGGVMLTTTDGADAGDASCSTASTPPITPGFVCVSDLGGVNGIVPGETVTIEFDGQISGQVAGCCNQGEVSYAERSTPVPTDDPATPGLVDDQTCLEPPPCAPTGQLQKAVLRQLDADGDARLEVGERIEYQLTFTNVGCGDLTNIRILDASQACLTIDETSIAITPAGSGTNNSTPGQLDVTFPGPLAPAASVSIVVQGIGAVSGPNCCNQATWTATELPAGGVSDRDTSDFTPDQPTCNDWLDQNGGGGNPDLVVTKTLLESGCAAPGSKLNYQIVVDNVGDGTLNSYDLTDPLSPSLSGVVADPPLTYDAGTHAISVRGGPLNALASDVYTFQATVPCAGSGTIANTARVAYIDNVPSPQERASSVSIDYGVPDLTTSRKTFVRDMGANGVFESGETAAFTITVTNTGTCAARGVVVTDDVPVEFTVGDPGTSIQNGGVPTGNQIRWDEVGEPALGSIPVGGTVVLTFTVPVAAGITNETHVTNPATIVATGNDLSGCGGTFPTASVVTGDICIQCAPIGGTQDLLVNSEVTSLPTALAEERTLVFNAVTPNTSTCGDTELDRVNDVFQTNVGPTLPTGITIPAGTVAGDPLVFIQVSEYCTSDEGGVADPIFVCKSRTTGDLTVRSAPVQPICP